MSLCATIVVCALAYLGLAISGNGLVPNAVGLDTKVTLWDALYFSTVTLTSLGYGDLRPVGVARFVASAEVLFGVALVALLIGKLASERQSQLVKLIYTSDNERRLRGFAGDLAKYGRLVRRGTVTHDDGLLVKVAIRVRKLLQSLKSAAASLLGCTKASACSCHQKSQGEGMTCSEHDRGPARPARAGYEAAPPAATSTSGSRTAHH